VVLEYDNEKVLRQAVQEIQDHLESSFEKTSTKLFGPSPPSARSAPSPPMVNQD
jgi:hypothetical protein